MGKDTTHESTNGCPFCTVIKTEAIEEKHKTAIAFKDKNPVSRDHLLIIPIRHVADYFALTNEEKCHADTLITICRNHIRKLDPSVTGFNIGINCGKSAGQTIFHCHIHLIPRRDSDTPFPRGGVRGVIPEKMNYPYSK